MMDRRDAFGTGYGIDDDEAVGLYDPLSTDVAARTVQIAPREIVKRRTVVVRTE